MACFCHSGGSVAFFISRAIILWFLLQNLNKATNAVQKQTDLVKLHEQSKKNLEDEIQNYKNEAQKQRKIIYQLEKERDCFINEASDLKQKVEQLFVQVVLCSFNSKLKDHTFISLYSNGRNL